MSPTLMVVVGLLVAVAVWQFLHLCVVLVWADEKTNGLNYYGRPLAERQRFKQNLRRQAILLAPTLWILSKVRPFRPENATFVQDGVPGPLGTCRPESFQRAMEYAPTAEDVFIATPMKCGTTFMQFLVYQLLTRSHGELVPNNQTLYSVSPWIESHKTVTVDEAPLIGEARPTRLIKTHLPANACPYSEQAKYIYVIRHPLSCFVSWADFITGNLGVFAPPAAEFERWYMADELMWWTTWSHHAAGWWQKSQESENVLFVRFEDMKDDLPGIAQRVSDFLELELLSESELQAVVQNCSFSNMQQHSECFEMHPPHLLSATNRFFVSGRSNRHQDAPEQTRQRILEWCKNTTPEDVRRGLGYDELL